MSFQEYIKTASEIAHQSQEILVKISFWNGETLQRRFADCETAWNWQRDESKKRANRRAKADRVQTRWAFYCGCTITGETYGGWLVGNQNTPGAENLEWSMLAEKSLVSRLK